MLTFSLNQGNKEYIYSELNKSLKDMNTCNDSEKEKQLNSLGLYFIRLVDGRKYRNLGSFSTSYNKINKYDECRNENKVLSIINVDEANKGFKGVIDNNLCTDRCSTEDYVIEDLYDIDVEEFVMNDVSRQDIIKEWEEFFNIVLIESEMILPRVLNGLSKGVLTKNSTYIEALNNLIIKYDKKELFCKMFSDSYLRGIALNHNDEIYRGW